MYFENVDKYTDKFYVNNLFDILRYFKMRLTLQSSDLIIAVNRLQAVAMESSLSYIALKASNDSQMLSHDQNDQKKTEDNVISFPNQKDQTKTENSKNNKNIDSKTKKETDIDTITNNDNDLNKDNLNKINDDLEQKKLQDQLQLYSSNSQIDLYCFRPCQIQSTGSCFVDGKRFSDIVRQLPEGEVGLSVEGTQLVVRMFERAYIELKIPFIKDFVWIEQPDYQYNEKLLVDCAQVKYMIKQVHSSIQSDPNEDEMSQVGYMHRPSNDFIRLIGLDSYRLSYCQIKTTKRLKDNLTNGVYFSKKAITQIERMSDQGFENLALAFSSDRTICRVSVPDYLAYIRLSYGKFDNYLDLIPDHDKMEHVKFSIDRNVLIDMARRILITTDSKLKNFNLSIEDDQLSLMSLDYKGSSGVEKYKIDYKLPSKVNITIKGDSFIEILRNMNSDHVSFEYTDSTNTYIIYPTTETTDCRSFHVVAPISDSSDY